MIRLEMKKCHMILTEKHEKKSTILSGKNYKYEYLTGEEILPFNQREVTEQAKCTYSPFTKSF